MPSQWLGGHDELSFISRLADIDESRTAALETASRSRIPTLRREEQIFKSFVDAIEAVAALDDPLSGLQSARSEMGNAQSNIYVLRVAPWCAYYYADPIEKICVGLLVCRDDMSIVEKIKMIGAALGRNI